MTNLATLRAALIERAAMDKRHAALGVPTNTGDVGEAIVAALNPTWRRMPPLMAGYDFIDDAGLRVQVKTWASDRRTHDWVQTDADRFIRVVLREGDFAITDDILLTPAMFVGAALGDRGLPSIAIYRNGRTVDQASAAAKAVATKRRNGTINDNARQAWASRSKLAA